MAAKNTEKRGIYLPIKEKEYHKFERDKKEAHRVIQKYMNEHPEFFPSETLEKGYILNGKDRKSVKLGISLRRIKINNQIYRIRPTFILPYMRGKTKEVEKALFLIRFGVPFWVLAVVFGRNPMYWYRLFISLSTGNLVGTTVYDITKMPKDILADEFHIRLKGVKAYVATIIAKSCFLGVEACAAADEISLRKAYGIFKTEIQQLIYDYQPLTINTDGWWATQNALRHLFNLSKLVECFLHAFIKVRDRATKKVVDFYQIAADKIWDIYRCETKLQMAQQIRRLREWSNTNLPACAMKENILKLCKKKDKWLSHFDVPTAYRTSAQLDRVMKLMERHAINSQMFHSNISMTSKNFRALALIYNFSPSCPAVTKKFPELKSPAERLNGFAFADSWLENLHIAKSIVKFQKQRNPL